MQKKCKGVKLEAGLMKKSYCQLEWGLIADFIRIPFFSHHFVCTILYVQYHFVRIPFCLFHFVPYHFVLNRCWELSS